MTNELNTRLVTGSQKYDLVFAENEKNEFHNICASIVDELVYLSSLLHRYNNNNQEGLYVDDQLDFDNGKINNETATNTTRKLKTTTDSIISLNDFIEKFSSANNANRKVIANWLFDYR